MSAGEILLSAGEILLSAGEILLSAGENILSSVEILLSAGEPLLSALCVALKGFECLVRNNSIFFWVLGKWSRYREIAMPLFIVHIVWCWN